MADLKKLRKVFNDTLESLRDAGEFEDDVTYEEMKKRFPQLADIANRVSESIEDGLQWEDVTVLGEIVGPFMEVASQIHDFDGETKKRFVINAVWLTYKAIDGYPDGNKNNIDIPYLFGVMEGKVERLVVRFAADLAVNALFKKMRERNEV